MDEQTIHKIKSLAWDADDAIEALNSARREACSEFNERIRKLRDFRIALKLSAEKSAGEMFDVEASISPEVKRLLADPTHSL